MLMAKGLDDEEFAVIGELQQMLVGLLNCSMTG
jgi:hypothetical protein